MAKNQYDKIFVVDTNVLIHRPDAILSFKESEVVIPLWVLEELDKLKTFSDERGRNARHAIRFIDQRAQKGKLAEGVRIENGSLLRVEMDFDRKYASELSLERTDNKIILCALTLQEKGRWENSKRELFFVSKDINARVKARAVGLFAVDYEKQKASMSTLYSGFQEASMKQEDADLFERDGSMSYPGSLYHNQFVQFSVSGRDTHVVGKYDADLEQLRYVESYADGIVGIHPLNLQQQMAFDLLLDDRIKLVSLVGKAGTGKTLLAIAAGFKKIFDSKSYTRMLVSRPVMPLGKDIGFLPGDKDEKLSHWMKPLYDNMELIASQNSRAEFKSVETIMKTNKIEVEAITYIRGRSLPKQYIIVDEAQNLSPHEIKTIVSRAGKETKVVLTGDPYQIDTPYLDSDSNGLTYLVEAFKGQRIFGHVTLERSERSELAELAAELL